MLVTMNFNGIQLGTAGLDWTYHNSVHIDRNFKRIEPSTQIALMVNSKKISNFPKTDLDDAVDNAVSDFWKELEDLKNGEDHRSLSGPM